MHYCTTCGWFTGSNGEYTEDDCNERAIQHYVETEHTVVHRSFGRESDRSPIVNGRRADVSQRL